MSEQIKYDYQGAEVAQSGASVVLADVNQSTWRLVLYAV
jgi:hypothetical protein